MHRSRLAGIVIDSCDVPPDEAARFWCAALGMAPRKQQGAYVILESGERGLDVELQTVSHPSRVHLEIETDDLDAEVARLEALGARRVAQVKGWWVLEAPTGQRFCVFRPPTLEGKPG